MAEPGSRLDHIALDFVAGAFGTLVAKPLRTGTFRLASHAPAVAGIAIGVGGLYALVLLAITTSDQLRAAMPLVWVPDAAGQAVLPAPLVPVVLLLVGIAMAVLLAGAQRCTWWLRMLSLGAALLILSVLVVNAAARDRGPALIVAMASLVAIAAACGWSWGRRWPLAADAALLIVLVEACLVACYRSFIAGGLGLDLPYEVIETRLILGWFILLASPLAFLGGLKTVAFGVTMCTWSADFTRRRLRLRPALVILGLLIAGELVLTLRSLATSETSSALTMGEHLAAVVLVGLSVAAWNLVRLIPPRSRRKELTSQGDDSDTSAAAPAATVEQASRSIALPVALAFLSAALIAFPVLLVRLLLVDVFPENPLLDSIAAVVTSDGFIAASRVAATVAVVVACVLLARRGRLLTAGLAAVSATMLAAFVLTQRGALLEHWAVSVAAIGDVGLALTIALLAIWTAQRRLCLVRVQFLILLALLSALVKEADFFAVPFALIAGVAASAFLIFGLVWGFLTDGGSAHEDSPAYPRDARLLIFLGQALFGISIVAWATIGRQSGESGLLSAFAAISVQTLGTAVIVATGCDGWRAMRAVDRSISNPG